MYVYSETPSATDGLEVQRSSGGSTSVGCITICRAEQRRANGVIRDSWCWCTWSRYMWGCRGPRGAPISDSCVGVDGSCGCGGAAAAAAAAAAALLVHPLAMDITHSTVHSLSKTHASVDQLRHTTSSGCGASVGASSCSGGGGGAREGLDGNISCYSNQWIEGLLLRSPMQLQYYAAPRVYINRPSSHVLVFPNPRWVELHRANPVYIKNLIISSLSLTVSIRTSEHRISRQVLHIVDALPLDTPYMTIQIAREKRKLTVCSWQELLHSLRNSYLRQFIRQSLPSAWISNPCAFVVGFVRGASALWRQTLKGVKTNNNSFEGLMMGFRVGFILFIIYTMGGIMQSLSHVLNILHKIMRGSRPRPYGVLDAFWKGLNGFLLDTFWRPWVAVVTEPAASATRYDFLYIYYILYIYLYIYSCIYLNNYIHIYNF